MLDGDPGAGYRGDAVMREGRRSESAVSDGAIDDDRERQNAGVENDHAAPLGRIKGHIVRAA